MRVGLSDLPFVSFLTLVGITIVSSEEEKQKTRERERERDGGRGRELEIVREGERESV